MILIAPDKFKGTLSAREAADIIASALGDHLCVKMPMADGGEGTASVLCPQPQWQPRDGYYVDRATCTAVIDSSAVVGLGAYRGVDILHASSAPLGVKVREIIKGGCDRVVIGVGGTGCCDGGEGFLEALDKYRGYADRLVGLCDVAVPLLPECQTDDPDALASQPSALMFAPQKGATPLDMPVLYRRLQEVQRKYGHGRHSPFDGAGGGLGFALATAIGAPCYSGARYVLDNYHIDWDRVDAVITGEGRIDQQTSQGKAAWVVARDARSHGVPCIAIGGCVAPDVDPEKVADCVIDASRYLPGEPLTAKVAADRLRLAAQHVESLLRSL